MSEINRRQDKKLSLKRYSSRPPACPGGFFIFIDVRVVPAYSVYVPGNPGALMSCLLDQARDIFYSQ